MSWLERSSIVTLACRLPRHSPTLVLTILRVVERTMHARLRKVFEGQPPLIVAVGEPSRFIRREFGRIAPRQLVIPLFFTDMDDPEFVGFMGVPIVGRPYVTILGLRVAIYVPHPHGTPLTEDLVLALAEKAGLLVDPFEPSTALRSIDLPNLGPPIPGISSARRMAAFRAPAGLPVLAPDEERPERPEELGWLNYWSRESARLAGLDVKQSEGIAEVRRVGSGWFIKLTQKPLQPWRNAHLDCLRDAYQRFPGVGRPSWVRTPRAILRHVKRLNITARKYKPFGP